MHATKIVLKLSGMIFKDRNTNTFSTQYARHIAQQIRTLSPSYQFGIVIGGGNIFKGAQASHHTKLTPSVSHQIGMLATIMNGLILKDIFESENIPTAMLSSLMCPDIAAQASYEMISTSVTAGKTIIFVGGIGTPFFTTDTSAIIRALQLDAAQVWKGTLVDGVYAADPAIDKQAKRFDRISLQEAISEKLGIMDTTAYVLAQEHKKVIRVFNIFTEQSLLHAAQDQNFGTILA